MRSVSCFPYSSGKYSIVGEKYHFVSEWLVIVCCKVWCVYEVNHRAELGPSDIDLF